MKNITLTKNDKQILESYKLFIDGLSAYLGTSYEIVLHSLGNLEKSVIYIVNGEHTGRKIGAPITDLALRMYDNIQEAETDFIVYNSKNKKGEPLKSATIAIRGEMNRIIGLICINMYLNTSFYEVLSSFIPSSINSINKNDLRESFSSDTDDLIKTAIEEEKDIVMADASILPSNKNKIIVEKLYDRGIFNLKDSIIKVEKLMGISKNTIYMHIRNYRKKMK